MTISLPSQFDDFLATISKVRQTARKSTFEKLPAAIMELSNLVSKTDPYCTESRYAEFWESMFKLPLEKNDLGRYPGSQNRDTFFGFFHGKSNTKHEGISIKISHPVYCPDECTQRIKRLRKAEYLGKPYFDDDIMFFLIEDNAVYLPPKYNKQFGIFSGHESFNGLLEVRNADNVVILSATKSFKGWER